MRKPYLLIPFFFGCCSCATIINSNKTPIMIDTDREASLVIQSDTLHTKNNRVTASVLRSNQPLEISVIADSIHRNFSIDPRNSFAWWANILGNYGIGMLVDKHKPKRYGYPRQVYLNLQKSTNKYYHYIPSRPRQFYFLISMPYVNSFLIKPENNVSTSRGKTGFFGASLGIDYYYKQNKFLRVSAGVVANFPIPFPAPLDIRGDVESMSSHYLSISNNYQFNRFLLGYGLSFAKNSWRYFNNTTTPVLYYGNQDNTALGIVLQSYYKLGRTFYIGAIYKPTFIRFTSKNSLQYEHLISIDLAWRIRL